MICYPEITEKLSTEKALNASQRSLHPTRRMLPSNTYLLIHGGAGTISRDTPKDLLSQYRAGLREALKTGNRILEQEGTSLDAVCAAVAYMENSPLFNAGKGAVFTEDGTNELEASVMTTNATRRTMSATLLRHVKNPILLVKALLTRRDLCPHAFISDVKAEDLAKELGLELVNQEYFYTDKRWQEHKQTGDMSLPRGTVGAVALDIFGEISVATSTGGLTNKFSGRIGDTPVAGAGYWADLWKTRILRRTRKVGVSGTGDGDWFIRLGTARTVVESVKRGLSLKKASRNAVGELWNEAAAGGVIVLDNRGKWAMDFNCDGMFRGYAKDGEIKVAIFRDDELE